MWMENFIANSEYIYRVKWIDGRDVRNAATAD